MGRKGKFHKKAQVVLFILLIASFLFLYSCTWSPIVVKQGRYIPAETLNRGSLEAGVESYLYFPAVLSLEYGLTDELEIRASGGYSGNSYDISLDTYYQLIKTDIFLMTGFTSETVLFEPKNDFFAINSSVGIIPGIKLWNRFTIYAPVALEYFIGGKWGNGFGFTPGIGINYSFKKIRIGVEFNYPIPQLYGDETLVLPYLGAGLFLRF